MVVQQPPKGNSQLDRRRQETGLTYALAMQLKTTKARASTFTKARPQADYAEPKQRQLALNCAPRLYSSERWKGPSGDREPHRPHTYEGLLPFLIFGMDLPTSTSWHVHSLTSFTGPSERSTPFARVSNNTACPQARGEVPYWVGPGTFSPPIVACAKGMRRPHTSPAMQERRAETRQGESSHRNGRCRTEALPSRRAATPARANTPHAPLQRGMARVDDDGGGGDAEGGEEKEAADDTPIHEDPTYIAKNLVHTERYLRRIQKDDEFHENLKLETEEDRRRRLRKQERILRRLGVRRHDAHTPLHRAQRDGSAESTESEEEDGGEMPQRD